MMVGGADGRGHAHHEWLAKVAREIAEDYERLHAQAREPSKVQQSGHGAESSWERFLQDWLPAGYAVGRRKYILPEVGAARPRETDLVIFDPAYPVALRSREEVLAAGVAAAFSVKLTLDAAGLREAAETAAELQRMMRPRSESARSELLGMFPFGVLAHSHTWKAPGSQPVQDVRDTMWSLDEELAATPREMLDMICVADLGTWRRMFVTYLGPSVTASHPQATERQRAEGVTMTALVDSAGYEREDGQRLAPPPAVAVFLTALLQRLGHTDRALAPLARALEITGTSGEGSGLQRLWDLEQVYSDDVRRLLPSRIRHGDPDWGLYY
jgi:hypothetical protein